MRSALRLADAEHLTLAELLQSPSQVHRLMVLSACQTSLPSFALPDEATSLAAGLLFTGNIGVIGSLWRVPDDATACLMSHFYRLWRKGRHSPADALRRAQLRLAGGAANQANAKSELGPDWRNPYYWAGFVYVGR